MKAKALDECSIPDAPHRSWHKDQGSWPFFVRCDAATVFRLSRHSVQACRVPRRAGHRRISDDRLFRRHQEKRRCGLVVAARLDMHSRVPRFPMSPGAKVFFMMARSAPLPERAVLLCQGPELSATRVEAEDVALLDHVVPAVEA
jgi:hypothetical protein